MADSTPSSKPPDDMHWGISYLREDLQDQRQESRSMAARIESRIDGIENRIDALNARIDSRFALLLTAMVGMNGVVIGAVFGLLRIYLPQ